MKKILLVLFLAVWNFSPFLVENSLAADSSHHGKDLETIVIVHHRKHHRHHRHHHHHHHRLRIFVRE